MRIWKYITVFLGGIITGILVFMKLKKPDQVTVINAETYVENQTQEFDKIKVSGRGNKQGLAVDQSVLSKNTRKEKI